MKRYYCQMAKGQLKKKKAELRQALRGGVQDHHRFQAWQRLQPQKRGKVFT